MWLQAIAIAAGSLATIPLALIAYNLITYPIIYSRFKTKLRGLKIADRYSPIDGHLRSIFLNPNTIDELPELFARYGKTFGLFWAEKPVVFTNDLNLVQKIILEDQALDRIVSNSPVGEVEFDSIWLAPAKQWRRLRRALAPALKSNKFKQPNVISEIDGSINKLVQVIEAKFAAIDHSKSDQDAANGPTSIELNFDGLAHKYALDLTLSCFYKQDKVIDFHSDEDKLIKALEDGVYYMMHDPAFRWCITFPIVRPIIDWLMLNFHPQGQWRKLLLQFIKQQTKLNLEARKQIQKSKAEGRQVDEDNIVLEDGSKFRRNMIDYLIDQFHEGKLTKQEYFHTSWFLLNASDKTTTDSIIYTLYQLATNQDIQDKLRASIITESIESEYLAWVLNESLRMLPPTHFACARTIEKDVKLTSGEGVVPAKTFVMAPLYTLHRLPEYWGPDADQFKPERFAQADKFHPFQFIPFGAGPRMCPGKDFALFEMKKLFCTLLTRYKFHCEPMKNRYSAPFLILMIPEKPTVVTVTRLDNYPATAL